MAKINYELNWHKVKNIELILLTIPKHIVIKLVFCSDLPMFLKVVNHLLCAIGTQIIKIDDPRNRRPFEREER